MKNILTAFTLLALFASCQTNQTTDSSEQEPLAEAISYKSYGEEILSDRAQSVFALNQLMKNQDSLNLKLTGEIEKTCKMKGCWMTIKTGDSTSMRVTFKDYGFFVPKEGMEGKNTIIEGSVTKTMTSVDVLRHYAQDEGKSAEEINAITEPLEEYAFIATGVLIEE